MGLYLDDNSRAIRALGYCGRISIYCSHEGSPGMEREILEEAMQSRVSTFQGFGVCLKDK